MEYTYKIDWLSLQFEDKDIDFNVTERLVRYNREVVNYYLNQDLPNFLKIKKIEDYAKINKEKLTLSILDLQNCISEIFREFMKVYNREYVAPQVYMDVSLKDELLIVIENEYYQNYGKNNKTTEIRKYQIDLSDGKFILNIDDLLSRLFDSKEFKSSETSKFKFHTYKPISTKYKQLFLDKLLVLIDTLSLFQEITITVNREE